MTNFFAFAALASSSFGFHALKALGTIIFSALVIWLVIRILKED